MKVLPVGLGVAGAIVIVSALVLAIWAGMPPNPLETLGMLTGQAGAMIKLVLTLLMLQAVSVAVVGAPRLLKRGKAEGQSGFLTILTFMAPALGLLGALYGLLTVKIAMANTGVSELVVVAPSLAEAMMPLGLGLLLGAVAAALNAGRQSLFPQGT